MINRVVEHAMICRYCPYSIPQDHPADISTLSANRLPYALEPVSGKRMHVLDTAL
jgi:hypothetical protein